MRYCRWIPLVLVVVLSLQTVGEALLHGTLETTIATDLSGATLALLADTLSTLTIDYSFDPFLFESVVAYDLEGLDYLAFSLEGEIGTFTGDSSLVFYPIDDSTTKTKTTTGQTHWYDLGREYFVERLEVKNVNATSSWYIRVSADNASWTTVSPVFGAATTLSGQLTVNMLVRYVEVRATTGLLQASPSSPEELTIWYSNELWKTNFVVPGGLLTLYGTFALPKSGIPFFFFTFQGPQDEEISAWASLKFDLLRPDCHVCFKESTANVSSSFGCIEEVTINLQVSDSGFDRVKIALEDIETGLNWLDLSGTVTFSLAAKEVEFAPELSLKAGPCFTTYAKLETGTTKTEITGITLYGIGVNYSWNALYFSSLSYLDSTHYVPVRGQKACWEAFTIGTTADSCCGGWVDFEFTTSFSKSSDILFDWAETDFEISLSIGPSIELSMLFVLEETGCTYASATVLVEW